MRAIFLLTCALFLLLQEEIFCQTTTLTLEQAIAIAIENYPSIKASLAQEFAAKSEIDLARTSYLPKMDLIWQTNRTTSNNITGSMYSQSIMPNITGPVTPRSSSKTAWCSAAGVLLIWEPFDFGLRQANVNLARVQLEKALKESRLTEFNLMAIVADSYIKVLAAKQTVRALKANLERTQTFLTLVESLVKSGLRPDVDFNRAMIEISSAKVKITQAIENEKIGLEALGQFLGIPGKEIMIEEDRLLTVPNQLACFEYSLADHPVLSLQMANVNHFMSKEISVASSYAPEVNLLLGASARGSGFDSMGRVESDSRGLGLARSNYSVGISVTFALLDYAPIEAKKRIARFNAQRESALYDQIAEELTSKIAEAQIAVQSALEVAQQLPVQLKYSRDSEKQITVRYQSGLVNILEVADAQRQLTQADAENDLAALGVWRALLNLYIAQGDLSPFLMLINEISQRGQEACGSSFQP